jgi:hypothetical protein
LFKLIDYRLLLFLFHPSVHQADPDTAQFCHQLSCRYLCRLALQEVRFFHQGTYPVCLFAFFAGFFDTPDNIIAPRIG